MVYEKKYGNGLRLVVKQMEGLLSVTMGILVGTGSSWETDSEDGISHFIEQLPHQRVCIRRFRPVLTPDKLDPGCV